MLVNVRFDEATGRTITSNAHQAGKSAAAYVRDVVVRALDLKADPVPPKRARRPKLLPADVDAMTRLTATVARANGAVVQLSKLLRHLGHAELHTEAERVLRLLKEMHAQTLKELKRVRR